MECQICHKKIDNTNISNDNEDYLHQSNFYGMESLPESVQAFVEGKICSKCLEKEYP